MRRWLLRNPEAAPIVPQLREFAALVPISAATGAGVEKLLAELRAALPLGPRLFPDDMLTDTPERQLVSERIREQVFHATYREIPYATAITIDAQKAAGKMPTQHSRNPSWARNDASR